MPFKLEKYKEFIISEYRSKNIPKIAKENGWNSQSITSLLKSCGKYNSKRPNQGNIRYFQNCDNNNKAYLLGFIAADGCLQSNGGGSNGLTITIHEKDISIVDFLREEIGCQNRIYKIRGKATHDPLKERIHCRFQLFNNYLYSDLLSYGLTPRKSLTMTNIILNIPEEHRKQFIMGYFDGDGSVMPNKKRGQLMVSFRGTEQFLRGISVELNLSKFCLFKDKEKNCYTLTFWRKSDIINFFNIYKQLNIYLPRKHNRFLEFLKIDKEQTISPS